MKFDYKTTVKIFAKEQYSGEWIPENLAGAIAWLQGHLASIPEQYRSSAKLEIESISGYEDSPYLTINIQYQRPPTPEEIEERKQQAAANAVSQLEWAKRRVAEEEARLAALLLFP